MKKWTNKQGFTLAELLIVVAIIAILVAIGIPVFSTAMERSRETVDLANIRAAYAEFQSGNLSANGIKGGMWKIDFKQTDGRSWLVDTSGLKNLLAPNTAASADGSTPAVYALDTPKTAGAAENAVKFTLDGTGKPKLEFDTFPTTTPASPTVVVLSDTPVLKADGTIDKNDDGSDKYEITDKTTFYLYK